MTIQSHLQQIISYFNHTNIYLQTASYNKTFMKTYPERVEYVLAKSLYYFLQVGCIDHVMSLLGRGPKTLMLYLGEMKVRHSKRTFHDR